MRSLMQIVRLRKVPPRVCWVELRASRLHLKVSPAGILMYSLRFTSLHEFQLVPRGLLKSSSIE